MSVELRCITFNGYLLSTHSVPDAVRALRGRLRRRAALPWRSTQGAGTGRDADGAGTRASHHCRPGVLCELLGAGHSLIPLITPSAPLTWDAFHPSVIHPSLHQTFIEHLLCTGHCARLWTGGGEYGPVPVPQQGGNCLDSSDKGVTSLSSMAVASTACPSEEGLKSLFYDRRLLLSFTYS